MDRNTLQRDARLMAAVAGLGGRSALASEVDLRLGLVLARPTTLAQDRQAMQSLLHRAKAKVVIARVWLQACHAETGAAHLFLILPFRRCSLTQDEEAQEEKLLS